MGTMITIVVLALGVVLLVWHVVAARRFRLHARAMANALRAGPQTGDADPPEQVRGFALRNGAGQGGRLRAVTIRQDGVFQVAPGKPFAPMPASQTIALGAPGFIWFATRSIGALPLFRVIDALIDGRGMLQARLFGSIPVANADGPVLTRSEAMRYLAELPWAPDAILGNPRIVWGQDDGWITAALPLAPDPALVRFRLEDGDIVEMRATNRPAQARDGTVTLRDWQGYFSDYDWIGDRRIPLSAQVGYVTDGVFAPYWKGRVVSYQIAP